MVGILGELSDAGSSSPGGTGLLPRLELIWTQGAADAVIGLSCAAMGVAIAIVLVRRRDLPFRGILWAFAAFILGCGATHGLAGWALWASRDGLEADVRLATALAAVAAAVALWRGLPAALALPSPGALQQVRRELGARIRERDAAERASAAKSAFLARVSHEIRSPLNSILGYTDLLLGEANRTAEERRKLTIIQVSGSSLLAVVDDIVDFSRITAGEAALRSEPFGLHDLVDTTLAMVRPAAESKGLLLSVEIAPDLPRHLRGDEDRIRQILLNLLTNAIKFTAAGSVSLTLRREEVVSGRARITVAVKDTGAGIPPDRQATLFRGADPGEDAHVPRIGGSGLGLVICRKLVALMGGEIGFESHEGYGSTFWIRLDLDPVAAPPELPPPRPEPDEILPAPRILLVEDIPANQELVRLLLEEEGYAVDTASNGVEAVAMIRSAPYRLVLMDVQMPTMDGLTATRRIREMGGPSGRIPIVAMTGNILPHHLEACREAGMDDVIAKPFKRADLAAVIAHWTLIEGDRPRRPARDVLSSPA
ncbi:ATP-binding protein [Methylobacterium nodulans]|uniref:histidine kinase n=1 Tax=Methylobacterium nodulans (strain LMG 21967 / CNCM I-2342 / ORS 2060) TaxID=460265 RepID=B8IPW7_METNO|nr:ATP-binding protein [Methylobacterium nodulans]ACL56617.1 histidine kinase [Methylobacterium nodulans ORS 2060]